MILFCIAIFLCIFGLVMRHRWKKSLMSSMGRWIYDAEYDTEFWEWDSDVYNALVELDEEFPAAKVL